MANVTAFELDETVAATEDGVTLPPLPGIWRLGESYLPAALGMTLEELRDAVETLNLPLVEVKVPESQAYADFAPDASNRFDSEAIVAGGGREVTVEIIPADEPVVGDAVQVEHALDVSEQVEEDRAAEAEEQ